MDRSDIIATIGAVILFGLPALGTLYVLLRIYNPAWKPNLIAAERRAKERKEAEDVLAESGF
jgi:hypothetical protein